ncbi:MAG: hypothetical protein J1E78_05010 [Muribaculaceae bacterium]|nr:hypothetical protein [Muribaculaceae bacterium]
MKKLNIFLTGLALLMVGCTDDLTGFENGSQQTDTDGEMVDLTVSVSLDDLFPGGTRAEDDDQYGHADKIDMLVYAVRQVNDGKIGAILTQYGKGVDASLKNYNGNGMAPALLAMGDDYLNQEDHTQTILNIKEDKNDEDGKIHINLRVMRGTTFNLSLWAQSAECTAYNFKTLEAVEVDYSKMTFGEGIDPDIYDAFSASANFSVGQVNTPIEVKLTRALSQINIGLKADANDGNASDYTQIDVAFSNIPTTLNVVGSTVIAEKTESPTFSWPVNLNEDNTFVVKNTTDAGTGANTPGISYKYMGMCYILAPAPKEGETPTVTVDKITVTKNGTPYYHSQKILTVNRNWRTNVLFSRYKYLTPPETPEPLSVPKDFTNEGSGFEIPNSVKWSPFAESYEVSFAGLSGNSGDDIPETNYYTYEITYQDTKDSQQEVLPIGRSLSETEPFNVTIPAQALYNLANKKSEEDYPKLKVKVVSLNEVFYSNSQETEMKLNVNWDTSQTYTWNFQGTNDNLNGKAFYTYGNSLSSDGKSIAETEFGGDEYYGLYYEAMQKSDRSWNFTGNSINGGGGITTNLHFRVNGSCNIEIKGENTNSNGKADDIRDFIIDYGVTIYEGDPKDGFMLPSGISHANGTGWDEDGREGYAIYTVPQSTSLTTLPYFLDYNKVRAEGSKDFTNTPVTSSGNNRYPNGETEYFSTKAGYVYLYFFGGSLNLYAITLSYPGSN